jgi:hypothetical protein
MVRRYYHSPTNNPGEAIYMFAGLLAGNRMMGHQEERVVFITGIELARGFYHEIIENLVRAPHAAALLGEGSEVLGYDQPRSTDHSWGPRLQIFVSPADVDRVLSDVERGLPPEYEGYPVRFYSWQTRTQRHHVEVTTVERWVASQLRFSDLSELTPAKWLSTPQQHLLQFTAGAVFRDDIGTLSDLREKLAWYPDDVWLWMMAAEWKLVAGTQPLMGRTVEAGDLRGARLSAGRLARLVMELAFLQEMRYWPYPKWFGTAFAELSVASMLGPILDALLDAPDHRVREQEANRALELLGKRHNALRLVSAVTPRVGDFEVGINHALRPYRVLNADEFVRACTDAIQDGALRALPAVGAIDQLTHSGDELTNFTVWPQRLEEVYQSLLADVGTG